MPDLSDLAPDPADCGTVIIRGPKGDPGEPGPAGSTALLVADPITSDGAGTEGDPYVIGLALSTDADNSLSIGSDGGLYSPIPDGSETIVTSGFGTSATGTGTVTDPYVISSTVTAGDLGAITSVTGTDGVTATSTGTDVTVSAAISTTDGNQLILDAGGLYVAAQTSVGDNTFVIGDGLDQTGTGTAEDPYVLSVDISADAANALAYGTDGGLYVPDTPAGVTTVTAADATVSVAPTTGDVTVAANLSSDTGNTLVTGADGGLYAAGTSITGEPGVTITGDPASGYTVGPDTGYGYCRLRTPLTTQATWGTVPLELAAGKGTSVSSDTIHFTQPGIWFINAQVNANADTTTGTLYVILQGAIDDNYAGYYLDGTHRRFGAVSQSMLVSDGASTLLVQVQVTRDAGTQWPVVNAASVMCQCVQPMTPEAARDLRATLPPVQGTPGPSAPRNIG